MTDQITFVHYHCTHCGYEHELTEPSYSYPCKCPKCGERTTHDAPSLPTNRVLFDSKPHSYNWLDSSQKTIQIYMRAMTGASATFCMEPDDVPDRDDDPIDAVRYILGYVRKRYLYSTSLDKIDKVLQEMKSCEAESNKNARQNRLHKVRKQLVELKREYRNLISEEA